MIACSENNLDTLSSIMPDDRCEQRHVWRIIDVDPDSFAQNQKMLRLAALFAEKLRFSVNRPEVARLCRRFGRTRNCSLQNLARILDLLFGDLGIHRQA